MDVKGTVTTRQCIAGAVALMLAANRPHPQPRRPLHLRRRLAAAAAPGACGSRRPLRLNCETMSGDIPVWVMAFDPHVNGWKNVADGFMKKFPNVRVTVERQGGQGDMLAKYVASLSAKSGGDIFTMPGNMVYEWSMTEQILPLTPKLWSYDDAKKALWPEYILQSQVDNAGVGIRHS